MIVSTDPQGVTVDAPEQEPHSDTGNGWTIPSLTSGQMALMQLFPDDIPQPEASDAYANEMAPALTLTPGNATLLQLFPDDIPQPEASDAYANEMAPALSLTPGSATLLQLFPNDIPQPGFNDAYANETIPTQVPHCDTDNSWDDSTLTPGQAVLLQLFPHDIPQPDSSDAYANEAAPLQTISSGQTSLLQIFPENDSQPASSEEMNTAATHTPGQVLRSSATPHRDDREASTAEQVLSLQSTIDSNPLPDSSDLSARVTAHERLRPGSFAGLYNSQYDLPRNGSHSRMLFVK